MRERIFSAIAASALLSGCMPPPPAPAVLPAERSAVEAACADLAQVDLGRVPKEPDWSWVETLHRGARAGGSAPPRGEPTIKVASPAAGIGTPAFDISIWAARQPDGRWLVSKARRFAVPPPPRAPGDDPRLRIDTDPALRGGVFSIGYLDEASARKLDAALASDCLRRQPRVATSPLPLKGGGEMHCPPDAGSLHALEIVEGSGSRRFTHSCGRYWASGLIVILLESAVLEPA